MTPTKLYEMLEKSGWLDPEKVEKYKRLDAGAIEIELKTGDLAVFRIEPRTKTKFLIVEWK